VGWWRRRRIEVSHTGPAIGADGAFVNTGIFILNAKSDSPSADRRYWHPLLVMTKTFAGRAADLNRIDHLFEDDRCGAVALHGMPGVGKTQLAAAWASEHRAHFDVGWWIPADNRSTIEASLAQLANEWLGVVEADQKAAAAKAVGLLNGRSRWLVVFDNARAEGDLVGLMPSGSGRVLITSRNPGFEHLASTLPVEPFARSTAVRFLQERTRDADSEAAGELAQELGGLALALEQAAAYCNEARVTLDGYLRRYRTDRARLLRAGTPHEGLAVQVTFGLAFAQVAKTDIAAVQLLRMFAFLAPTAGIPRSLFVSDKPWFGRRGLHAAAKDPIAMDRAIAVLRRLSLLATSGGQLSVHKLVQDILRDELEAGSTTGRLLLNLVAGLLHFPGKDVTSAFPVELWITGIAQIIGQTLPADPDDPRTWGSYAAILPHATAVLDHADQRATAVAAAETMRSILGAHYLRRGQQQVAVLQAKLGNYFLRRSEDEAAHRLLSQAAVTLRQTLPVDHPTTLTTLLNLGLVLYRRGDHTKAKEVLRDVVEAQERIAEAQQQNLGEKHPDTLMALNILASVLIIQDSPAALRLRQHVLAGQREILGEDHPDTIASLWSLAVVQYHEEGNTAETRRAFEQVTEVSRRALGNDHPTTLGSMRHLAALLDEQDPAAVQLIREELVTGMRQTFGDNHPDTLTEMLNLAAGYLETDEPQTLAAARPILEEAAAGMRQLFGNDHPHTRASRRMLAKVIAKLGDITTAQKILEQVVENARLVLGDDHPETCETRGELALLRARQAGHGDLMAFLLALAASRTETSDSAASTALPSLRPHASPSVDPPDGDQDDPDSVVDTVG
jgi:tetratricopeptide (TPR) repeat protein